MRKSRFNLLVQAIHWWEKEVLYHPWLIVVIALVACAAIGKYTADNLTVDTNTADMFSPDLPFQKNNHRLEHAFPQDLGTALLLIEGRTPEETNAAVEALAAGLRAKPEAIESVYIPDEGAFFTRNGMLYLDTGELRRVSIKLADAQPFIGRLARDDSLRGLFGVLGQALDKDGDTAEMDINPLLDNIREGIQARLDGSRYQLSWQQLMLDQKNGLGITKRFLLVKPILHKQEFLPAEQAVNAINAVKAQVLQGDLADVRMLLTGEVVLEYEELLTLSQSTATAGIVSLLMVCTTLWFAYRSFKLMFATFLTLTVGLVYSLGFATVAIGHLNLISMAFAVLFIGMGDAYSSHFCLRYRELILYGENQRDALLHTLTSTGSSLILCTITASIGLYAFIPTSYVGVSELGVIAGTSMFIALLTTFTLLPALIKLMPIDQKPKKRARKSFFGTNWPLTYARQIRYITGFMTLGALILMTRVEVDFNPINLRDPTTESVQTFKYLLKSRDTSPMTLTALAGSEQEAREKSRRFAQLETVDRVQTLMDFIPGNQQEKLDLMEEMNLLLGSSLSNFAPLNPQGAGFDTLQNFQRALVARPAKQQADAAHIQPLNETLTAYIGKLDQLAPEARRIELEQLQQSILGKLPATINNLALSLNAETVNPDSLPRELMQRWLSPAGLYRIQLFPKKDMNDLDSMREFIRDAQQIDPDVTDLPVTYLESMTTVVDAFVQAFEIALVAITLLLLVILRNIKDTLLVLLPLLLAALFTAACTVIFNVPFNFANIIALPLLFGLGVDSGIHMAHRLHYLRTQEENLLDTSEARGVFYGALTTIWSFSSLAFTPHRGTASMGILLALGLLWTLICALVVLPAFSEWHIKRKQGAATN
ncbi:MMPL family transporter [Candidatus Methylospira mobilis]|uniref:MMPL family transporter n=1 Tax=Candidatus Methylospira mobilis TaxID=1808979 RepID=A0A5Q0BRS1_9GAMM|nr:MMPL family transporter [Candidatus Methylospira mobilis]QFY44768.1 MMPL family transporter [Candidatus Methylospira mobilis]WNV05691.1 MMPL family transporter [Candidatus Methylospira mobilis]